MRVLITWGSERGGTEGIARILADALRRDGIEVDARPPDALTFRDIDAVIVGGAIYGNRWHHLARRFVRRHVRELRRVPVWFFSSGPLDDTADRADIGPTRQVAALMERVGARGHITFGGRLAPEAKGFPARAMAKDHSGDWRNPARIHAWADELAAALPAAKPGVAIEPDARSLPRLFAYVLGAALLAAVARVVVAPLGTGLGIALHAVAAAAIATVVTRRYFHPRGARDPLPTGIWFATGMAFLDVIAVALRSGDVARPSGLAAIIISTSAVLLAVWTTGGLMSTMPWPRGRATGART